MEIKVCLENRDFNGKHTVNSMFPQETWYLPMVIVVIWGGAVWLKSILKKTFLGENHFCTFVRIRPEIDFSQNRDSVEWPIANWSHTPPDTSCMLYSIYFTLFDKKMKNHWFSIYFLWFSPRWCLINTINSNLTPLDMWSPSFPWLPIWGLPLSAHESKP